MRHIPYACPASVDEVVELLARQEGARVIAGGTDLLVQLLHGVERPTMFISVHAVEALREVRAEGDTLHVGSAVTLARIVDDPMIREAAPLLSKAAATMASPPVRSRGTIGGNLCNASPAADLAPPLLVHEARVVVRGQAGERSLPLSEFLVGPGETALGPSELVTEVVVPKLPREMVVGHLKHQVGVCGNLSIISLAVGLALEGEQCTDARVALGAVARTAARYPEVEEKLLGRSPRDEATVSEAAAMAGRSCSPIDDVRASCDHRCHLVEALLPRLIESTLSGGE